jgi:hypothetical protein
MPYCHLPDNGIVTPLSDGFFEHASWERVFYNGGCMKQPFVEARIGTVTGWVEEHNVWGLRVGQRLGCLGRRWYGATTPW